MQKYFTIKIEYIFKILCIYVNDVKQILSNSMIEFVSYLCFFYSSLFSFGVKYPNTAIGILFDLFKYAAPCFLKSSKL